MVTSRGLVGLLSARLNADGHADGKRKGWHLPVWEEWRVLDETRLVKCGQR